MAVGRSHRSLGRELKRMRSFLPEITQADLNAIACVLNSRPRKKLSDETPTEAVYNEIKIGSLQV